VSVVNLEQHFSVVIRPLVPADLEPAAEIVAVCTDGNVAHQLELLERRLERQAPDSALLVAEVDARIVGVSRVAYFEPAADAPANAAPSGWYLLGVNVDPACRRRGVGRALTVARLSFIAERASTAWFFTDASNEASIALHEALGFRPQTTDFWFPTATFGVGGGVLFSLHLRD